MTTNGALTTLVSFNLADGAYPAASLTLGPDGNFCGTTQQGGSGGAGTVFQLELSPDIITQPTNQPVCPSPAVFSASVTALFPSYECFIMFSWQRPRMPLCGSGLADERKWKLSAVTNSYGSITSQVASLNVLLQPNIKPSNGGVSVCSVHLRGSQPNSTNRLWASTNLALNQWQVIATNVTDSNGLSQFLDTNTTGMPQKFYRLSYP